MCLFSSSAIRLLLRGVFQFSPLYEIAPPFLSLSPSLSLSPTPTHGAPLFFTPIPFKPIVAREPARRRAEGPSHLTNHELNFRAEPLVLMLWSYCWRCSSSKLSKVEIPGLLICRFWPHTRGVSRPLVCFVTTYTVILVRCERERRAHVRACVCVCMCVA